MSGNTLLSTRIRPGSSVEITTNRGVKGIYEVCVNTVCIIGGYMQMEWTEAGTYMAKVMLEGYTEEED